MIKEIVGKTRFIRKIAERRGMIEYDGAACVFCGKCARQCKMEAITVSPKERKLRLDHGRCVRCGQCVKICPKTALTLSCNPSQTVI